MGRRRVDRSFGVVKGVGLASPAPIFEACLLHHHRGRMDVIGVLVLARVLARGRVAIRRSVAGVGVGEEEEEGGLR